MTWADAIRLVDQELTEQRWGPMPQAALRSVLAQMLVEQARERASEEKERSKPIQPKPFPRMPALVDWGEQ